MKGTNWCIGETCSGCVWGVFASKSCNLNSIEGRIDALMLAKYEFHLYTFMEILLAASKAYFLRCRYSTSELLHQHEPSPIMLQTPSHLCPSPQRVAASWHAKSRARFYLLLTLFPGLEIDSLAQRTSTKPESLFFIFDARIDRRIFVETCLSSLN